MSQSVNLYKSLPRSAFVLCSFKHIVSTCVLVAVVLLLYSSVSVFTLIANDAATTKLERKYNDAKVTLAKTNQLFNSKEVESIEESIVSLQTQIEEKQDLALQLQMPSDKSRWSLSGYLKGLASNTVSGVWIVDFTVSDNGQSILINGRSRNVSLLPIFVGKLESDAVFKGMNFDVSELSQPSDDGAVNFIINAKV